MQCTLNPKPQSDNYITAYFSPKPKTLNLQLHSGLLFEKLEATSSTPRTMARTLHLVVPGTDTRWDLRYRALGCRFGVLGLGFRDVVGFRDSGSRVVQALEFRG